MSVHGNGLLSESASEYHVSSLSADTWKSNELVQGRRYAPMEVAYQFSAALDDCLCLGPVIGYAGYFALKLFVVCLSEVFRRRVSLEESFRNLIYSCIRALRGEHGCDKELEGVPETKGDCRVRIFFEQLGNYVFC